MSANDYKNIVREISGVVQGIDPAKIDKVTEAIWSAPNIFCAGVGRSGYMMRAFSMRLMHCGLKSFFIGDSSTPGAAKDDILIIGSGSGETDSLKAYAARAAGLGVRIITVTSAEDSTLGGMADVCIPLKAPTPKASRDSDFESIQPMGTLFEQSLLICLDGIILSLMKKYDLTSGQMFSRHANLE